jgi:cell division protein FtsB
MRLLAVLLVAMLIALQVRLWSGAAGRGEVDRLAESVAAQARENERLRLRNDALAAEVDDLKEGEDAVEERARAELGMIRPGEVFYRIVEDAPTPGHAPERRR